MGTVRPLRGPQPTGSVEGLKLEQVRARLTSTSPEKVAAAGHAYNAASSKLSAAHRELNEAITYLSQRWRGPAASVALAALIQLRDTAQEIAAKSGQTGKALQQYGEKILPWYKSHLPGDGFIRSGRDDEYAQKLMARLNNRISQTYSGVPEDLRVRLPGISQGSESARDDAGPGLGAPPGGSPLGRHGGNVATPAAGSLPSTGPGSGGTDHDPRATGWGVAPNNTPGQFGTDLASTRTGMSPTMGEPAGPGAPTAGNPAAGAPVGGGVGGFAPTPPGVRPQGPSAGGTGRGLRPGGVSASGHAPRRGGAASAFPGGGLLRGAGGGGRTEDERERSTWLAEEQDIWGADDAVWAPSVIEASESAGPVVGSTGRTGQAEPQEAESAEEPEADGEESEVDLVLADLEAELERELEMAGLLEEGHSADGQANLALDVGSDGLLAGLPEHHTGHGGDSQTAK